MSRRPQDLPGIKVPARLTPTQRELLDLVRQNNERARLAKIQPGEKLTRPHKSHPGKPHGRAEPIRWRCLGCGMFINKKERTEWVHVPQVKRVTFGGRRPGGAGIIDWADAEDARYMPAMEGMLRKLAKQLGYSVTKLRKGAR